MSDLQNLTPANTYKGLLQVGDYTNGVDSTVRSVLDGEGTASALAISTTKVGIGTTSPTQELEVNGDIVSTTLTTSGAVTAGSVSTSGAVGAGSIDVGGNVVADEYALDQVGSSSSAVAIHAPATNELAIRTNSAERLRVDSSGNVGIDTTSPIGKLDIREGGDEVFVNLQGSTAGNVRLRLAPQGVSTNAAYIEAISAGTNTDLQLNESLYLKHAGKVGVGTESPSAILTIEGEGSDTPMEGSHLLDIKSTGNSKLADIRLEASDSGGSTRAGGLGFNPDDNVVYLTNNGEQFLNVDNSGNVGIGTTSPSAPLDVTSTTGGVIMPRMTTTQMNAISSPTDGEMIYNTTANKFYGRANGAWTALH